MKTIRTAPRIAASRRTVLAAMGSLPLTASAVRGATSVANKGLVGADVFAPTSRSYLDSGTMHPIPVASRQALDAYMAGRAQGHHGAPDAAETVKAHFARLINCEPNELAFVQSTTAGEQLVVDALGLPEEGAHVVTDTLHFFGSFWLYDQLARRGTEVTWLRPVDGRIDPSAYEQAITSKTKLVSLSLVSTYNGFEHDLAAICEIAHARGALVYADIIHAAGTVPFDVRASGVDFAASATYKWLMGDFGLGFLYARADRLERLERARFGYYQLGAFTPHVYPLDPPGESIADMAAREDAQGMFAMGTTSHSVVALLSKSLPLLLDLGVERITAHRLPLLARLHQGLAAKGYDVVTPPESRTPLVTAICEGARSRLAAPLEAAGVKITLSQNRFRVCPSFFNDLDDIERLLDALPAASGVAR